MGILPAPGVWEAKEQMQKLVGATWGSFLILLIFLGGTDHYGCVFSPLKMEFTDQKHENTFFKNRINKQN